jgi:Bacterial regulatory protein, Fis family
MKGDVWSRFSRKISSSGAAGQCTLRLGKSKAARELGIDRKTLTYSLEKAAERGAGPAPAEKPEPAPSPLAIDHAPQIASVDGAKTRRSTSTCTIAASRRRSDSARDLGCIALSARPRRSPAPS